MRNGLADHVCARIVSPQNWQVNEGGEVSETQKHRGCKSLNTRGIDLGFEFNESRNRRHDSTGPPAISFLSWRILAHRGNLPVRG